MKEFRKIVVFCAVLFVSFQAQGVWAQEGDRAAGRLAAPKKTVAVVSFENASGLSSHITLGNDFATQLNDALIQSGKFIVLSRTELDAVLSEQDLAGSNRFAKSLTAKKGKLVPSQVLITGKITEFDHSSKGGGQGLSIRGVTLGAQKSTAHVAVIVQIIDSTTGQILDSKRVEGKAGTSGFSIGYSGSFSIGSSSFKKTPLGKATQIAIDRAVEYISRGLAKIPWQGRVVTVKDGVVFVNAGANAGIASGVNFAVYRQGEALIDPETGIDLGAEKTKIADISITEVQPKFSKAKVTMQAADTAIQKADLVLEN